MRTLALAVGLTLMAVFSAAAAGTNPRPEAGAWTQFRGDRALSGHSAAKGRIRTPAVLWKQFIGARETLLRIRFGGGGETTSRLPQVDVQADRAGAVAAEWGLNGSPQDLDGTGVPSPARASSLARVAKLLPGGRGLQLAE